MFSLGGEGKISHGSGWELFLHICLLLVLYDPGPSERKQRDKLRWLGSIRKVIQVYSTIFWAGVEGHLTWSIPLAITDNSHRPQQTKEQLLMVHNYPPEAQHKEAGKSTSLPVSHRKRSICTLGKLLPEAQTCTLASHLQAACSALLESGKCGGGQEGIMLVKWTR